MKQLFAEQALAPKPSAGRMVGRGFVKHCPRCGGGHLFRHWFHMKARCPSCGYQFEREPDFWYAAYLINLMVTQGVLCVVLGWVLLVRNADASASIVVPLAVGVTLAVMVPVLFYPFSRTVWAAIDLAMEPLGLKEILEAEEYVDERREDSGDTRASPHTT